MKTETRKTILIIAFALLAGVFVTCEYNQHAKPSETTLQDTLFLSQWRREKVEKLKLIDSYNVQIQQLAQSKDSLNFTLAINKDLLNSYRLKTKDLKARVQTKVLKDTSQAVYKLIRPIIDSLISYQQLSDSACDLSIRNLESSVANRDSTIRLYIGIESNLKDIQKQQELNNQLLTEQLNTAFKNQRKKARQNKILAGCLLILSGITSALLISQNAK